MSRRLICEGNPTHSVLQFESGLYLLLQLRSAGIFKRFTKKKSTSINRLADRRTLFLLRRK